MSFRQLYWDGTAARVSSVHAQDATFDSPPKAMQGSCHCGKVTFTVQTPAKFPTVYDCNCSICSKRGYLHLTVPKELVHISPTSLQYLSTYQFGTRVAEHTFCKECGVQPIYVPRSNPDCYSVNVRCLNLEGIQLPIVSLNGKHFTGSLVL